MAENKKTFIAYVDWNTTFEKLSDEEAGKLAKMLFAYVSDKDPVAPDRMTDLLFDPIKNLLKKDLRAYENVREERSVAGRIGNLKRWNKDLYTQVIKGKLSLESAENTVKNRKTSGSDVCDANLSHSDFCESQKSQSIAVNDNVNDIYKYNTLSEIENFNVALKEYTGNKQYFYLAYRYWELWKKEFPNHKHLIEAKFKKWYDTVRLMVENDKQSIDRLVAIYIFLTKTQNKDRGYETFLFTQVKSLPALRETTKSGEYRLDNLAALTNDKLNKDQKFNSEVTQAISQFKEKFKQ